MRWWMMLRPVMKEEGDGAGGAGGTGGAGDESKGGKGKEESDDDSGDEGGGGKGKTVSYESYQRLMDDHQKIKKSVKEITDRDKKASEDKLKEENKHKELAESLQRERDEANDKLSKTELVFQDTLRANKVQEIAKRLGLRKEASDDLDRIDLSSIEVEQTSSGRYLIKGADKFVETLKKSKPHWFEAPKSPTINSGGGGGGGKGGDDGDGEVTEKTVWELEKKYGAKDPRTQAAYKKWVTSLGKKQA